MSMRKASTPTAAKPANHQATDNKDRLNQVLSIGLSTLSLNNESVGTPADKRKSEDEVTEEMPRAKVVAIEVDENDMKPLLQPPTVLTTTQEDFDEKIARAKQQGYDEGKQQGFEEGYERGKLDGRQAAFAEIQED